MKGVILFGHGSRDPQWRAPIDAVALRVQQARDAEVRCAFLELTAPDLPTVARELAEAGCSEVTIVPMFLGAGRHAREDLPALVAGARQAHPAVDFRLQPAVGEDARVLDLLAKIALE
jgi:sirohydrochlorin cobaltochelatase